MIDRASFHAHDWAAYRALSGGPDSELNFFFPFTKLAELDDWQSTNRVLIDVLGKDEGRAVIRDLEREIGSSDRVVHFSSELSRTAGESPTGPPPYLWIARTRIAPGKAASLRAVGPARSVTAANMEPPHGIRWPSRQGMIFSHGSLTRARGPYWAK